MLISWLYYILWLFYSLTVVPAIYKMTTNPERTVRRHLCLKILEGKNIFDYFSIFIFFRWENLFFFQNKNTKTATSACLQEQADKTLWCYRHPHYWNQKTEANNKKIICTWQCIIWLGVSHSIYSKTSKENFEHLFSIWQNCWTCHIHTNNQWNSEKYVFFKCEENQHDCLQRKLWGVSCGIACGPVYSNGINHIRSASDYRINGLCE